MGDTVFHAVDIDADGDGIDIGIFPDLETALQGMVEYILWDLLDETPDYWLQEGMELPWGIVTAKEGDDKILDWQRVNQWLSSHSYIDLITWYRSQIPDHSTAIFERRFQATVEPFSRQSISSVGEHEYGRFHNVLSTNASGLPLIVKLT